MFRSLSAITLIVFAAGCASTGQLMKLGPAVELPKELPEELRDKYEVKEVAVDEGGQAPSAPAETSKPADSNSEAKDEKKPAAKTEKKADRKSGKSAGAKGAKAAGKAKVAEVDSKEPEGPFEWPSRRPEVDPLRIGEKLVMEVNYFGLVAGDFTLSIKPYKEINGRKVYHIHGNALSSKLFSMFYRLNDTVESYMDYEGLFSHRFHLNLDETKQTRDSLEIFDSEKRETFYWNRWNHKTKGYIETKVTKPIPAFPQDSLSALYYLRMVELPKEGQAVKFKVASEGKTWEAVVWVERREMMDTPLGRRRCVVLKPQAKYDGVLKQQGDSFLWLTDDEHRYPVRFEAKVRIGTVKAVLKAVEPGQAPE